MTSAHRIAPVLLLLATTACSSAANQSSTDGGPTDMSDSGGSDGSKDDGGGCTTGCDGGGSGSGSSSGGSGGSSGSSSGGSPDGSFADAGFPDEGGTRTGDASTQDGAMPIPPPTLALVSANQSGRTGSDILLTITGSDDAQTAFGLDVKLLDHSGAPVVAFGAMGSTPASAERIVLFDGASAFGEKTFNATATLPGFMSGFPNIASVAMSIVDTTGTSNTVTAPITTQTVSGLSQMCDPKVVTSRCSSGLSCNPGTSVCTHPSTPPQLTQFAYNTDASGARMLFAGTDAADDLSSMHLEFLDSNGNPVMVDVTGNNDYQTSFDLSIQGASTLGSFFDAVQSTSTFSMSVAQLAATPTGTDTGAGNRVTAKLKAPTVVAAGAHCDARGFALCGSSDSCVGGICVATSTALTNATAAAQVLDPQASPFATGYAVGISLWGDPPSGCASSGATNLPEGIVTLHVAQPTPSLTLTTDNQETNVRAALFVLSGTGASVGTSSIGCNSGLPATVTLTNVQAGDYTVVVAALTPGSGEFAISVR